MGRKYAKNPGLTYFPSWSNGQTLLPAILCGLDLYSCTNSCIEDLDGISAISLAAACGHNQVDQLLQENAAVLGEGRIARPAQLEQK